ncbi:hypothetical protein [Aquimarina agarivorans]|uniref:hypothetical protein n=1 Tax=Aquimarina agarivorans TaxID=980584 RepID=UPI0002FC1848|nr:hypothetical protein [Aquimarina agarivorans]
MLQYIMVIIFALSANNPGLLKNWTRTTLDKFELITNKIQDFEYHCITEEAFKKIKITQSKFLFKSQSNSNKKKVIIRQPDYQKINPTTTSDQKFKATATSLIKVKIALMTTGEYAQYHIKKTRLVYYQLINKKKWC